MIKNVTVRWFKSFEGQEFPLKSVSLLAGPNNSGKSTLLQAVMVWRLALDKWWEKRGPESASKASARSGVPITRQEFTALPLPSMDQLWKDAQTSYRKDHATKHKPGAPLPMLISLQGEDGQGTPWRFGMELRYSSAEQLYARPVQEDKQYIEQAHKLSIIYVPPFSGIGVNETRYDRPYQDMLIGQGRSADILRNLLLDAYQRSPDKQDWTQLKDMIGRIFGYRLLDPVYGGSPYIVSQYLKGIPPQGKGYGGLPKMDIATAGSGFHQVLLILAFICARPSSLILLDEPDSHQHVLLQKELYESLLSVCDKRQAQLVFTTHSEVLIDSTAPQDVLSFYDKPHLLESQTQRDQVREAMKRITTRELLLAERAHGILYVEGESDFSLLREWARVLSHPLEKWFLQQPLYQENRGRNPKQASDHFFALQAIKPDLRGALLLDGDNRNLSEHNLGGNNLTILRWQRYEAESYLLHPDALKRYLDAKARLFSEPAMDYLREQMPPAFFTDPLAISDYLKATPASKTLLPECLQRAGIGLSKNQYFLIAEQMEPGELPAEMTEKLDALAEILFR